MIGWEIVAIGFFIDMVVGDPKGWYHSICTIGNLITWMEIKIRSFVDKSKKSEEFGGICLVIGVILATVIVVSTILQISLMIWYQLYVIVGIVMCWQILAMKSLKVESMNVYRALKSGDLEQSRIAVSMIVGRDTKSLTREGIIKATVETIAENTTDAVVAPIIYLFLGGPVLGYVYKAINTMDSMVGYKNEKYINFGKAAAKIDDVVNFIPARIAAMGMILASWICGYSSKNAWHIFKRDRFNHKSPNSAQTESVCAGALGIQLAGDAYYFGTLYKKPYIGDATRAIEAEDIIRANRLMYVTSWIIILIGIIGGIIWNFVNMAVMSTAIGLL